MKKKILVVDDNPSILRTLKEGLEEDSGEYEIFVVESGSECITFLQAGNIPDLILLDVMMPGMSGWDAASEIRKKPEWNNIVILFISAWQAPLLKLQNFNFDYMSKPFEIPALKEKIEQLLKNK